MTLDKSILLWVLEQSTMRKPFSAEALATLAKHPSKDDLNFDKTSNRHSLKKAWMVDILNEAFGVGQWSAYLLDREIVDGVTSSGKTNYTSCSYVLFSIPEYNYYELLEGGTTNLDKADSVKGGMTDVLSTVMMHISSGARSIWRGEGTEIMGGTTASESQATAKTTVKKIYVNFANGEYPDNEQARLVKEGIKNNKITSVEDAKTKIAERGWTISSANLEVLETLFV